jgi:glycosyltransferase involved in cell wall biosynthesis
MSVLFIGPLPDPVTGQSLACRVFVDDLRRREPVEIINLSKQGFRHGIDSVARVREVMSIVWRAWRKRRSSEVIYFTVSESVAGNLKDLLIYAACFFQLGRMMIHLHGGAGMRELLGPAHPLLRTANAFFLRRLGGVIVLGERHAPIYAGLVAPERLHIVPNFAEDEMFVDDSAVEGKFARPVPLRLLFLSNLLPGKGHIELAQAYLGLPAERQARLRIDFAGGFQTAEQLRDFLALIDGHAALHYHGIVHGERKVQLFRDAHVFCLPTYYPYEGQPISILEAYASGCAVLTTDHSGIPDVFADGVNGYCVAKRSPDSLAAAIERALADPQRLREMALANLATARNEYRVERYAARLTRIIDSLHGVATDHGR